MVVLVSSQVSPSQMICPKAGRYRPAIVRRIVVLPAPEGPISATISPGRHVNARSSGITPPCLILTVSPPIVASGMPAAHMPSQAIDDGDRDDREGEEKRRYRACSRRVERLRTVVDGERCGLGLPRDAAADHQHDAELAHGVCEGQDKGGEHARPSERQLDPPEGSPGCQPADPSG